MEYSHILTIIKQLKKKKFSFFFTVAKNILKKKKKKKISFFFIVNKKKLKKKKKKKLNIINGIQSYGAL